MKYNNKIMMVVIFLITTFFITDNKGIAMAERPYDYYREQLKKVDVSEGVSKEEAIIIAQNYVIDMIEKGEVFLKKLGLSKAQISEDLYDNKNFPDDWVVLFPMRYGLFKTWDVFYVNKITGKVIGGGPIK